MSWFQQGYEKVEQRAKEIDEAMAGNLPTLIIKDTDENVYVSFVTAEPITFYEHFLKGKNRSFTCPDNGDTSKGTCPLCAVGNKAGFKGAYLVIDHRYEEWTKDGKQNQRQHTLKVAKFGIRVLKSLQKLDAKLKKGSQVMAAVPAGILGVPFEVVRSGSGTDTQYTFNPLQNNPEYFPRQYELPKDQNNQPKTEITAIVDAIKPKSREKLLEVIGAPAQQAPQGNPYGQPAPFGNPAQPQGNPFAPQGNPNVPQGNPFTAPPQGNPFQQPQAQTGNPWAGGQPQQAQGGNPFAGFGDNDDVIDFGE